MTSFEDGMDRSTINRVVFIGAVHEAYPALAVLLESRLVTVIAVITPPESTLARLSGGVDLAGMARSAGSSVLRVDDVNAPDVVTSVQALSPSLLVVVGWPRPLGPELLAVPVRGCVGFHASLLPRNRGGAPVNWAILRGETVTGNTMMLLEPGVNAGQIVDQQPLLITPEDTCGTLYGRMGVAGAAMLLAHLPGLLAGTAPRRPCNPNLGNLLPGRTAEMGIIDWARSPRAVHDWVRALTAPYPGAFGYMDGNRVMVWATRAPSHLEPVGRPGAVIDVAAGSVRVGTESGSVLVTSMSAPGEQPEPAGRWCHRVGIHRGDQFDEVSRDVALWARGERARPVGV